MLKENISQTLSPDKIDSQKRDFAIVASDFNKEYVDSMLLAAVNELEKSGNVHVHTFRVPGAYEIPFVVGKLLKSKINFQAIICLGVVLRGETTHAAHITEAVCQTIEHKQMESDCPCPIINGVYLFENHAQAQKRCIDPKYNRGIEMAQTAICMAKLNENLSKNYL